MSGLAIVGMIVAIPALMLLGIKLYDDYQERKREKQYEEAQRKFLVFLRSLGVEGNPAEWALNQTKANKLKWTYNVNSREPMAKLGSGDDEVEIGVLRCQDGPFANYGLDFRYSNCMVSKRSMQYYLDYYEENEESGSSEGNAVVGELVKLVYGMQHVWDEQMKHEMAEALKRSEENGKISREIFRSVGISTEPLDYLLSSMKTERLAWEMVCSHSHRVEFKLPLKDGLEACLEKAQIHNDRPGVNTYFFDVRDNQQRFYMAALSIYDEAMQVPGGNIKVKELFELVEAQLNNKPQ